MNQFTDVYVLLERNLGSTDKRVVDNNAYRMVIPIWDGKRFLAPNYLQFLKYGSTFRKYLLEGDIILVYPNGSWNTLHTKDKILMMSDNLTDIQNIILNIAK